MEGEESLLDSLFDVEDVDMVDVEEGELVEDSDKAELALSSSMDAAVAQEPQRKSKRPRKKKKRNKKKKCDLGGSDVTDINR